MKPILELLDQSDYYQEAETNLLSIVYWNREEEYFVAVDPDTQESYVILFKEVPQAQGKFFKLTEL
jgi:hypothetical protein